MKISVVIPTYNRQTLLARCLEALCKQSINNNEYEIIVVSDGPDSATKKLIAKVKQNFRNLHHVELPRHLGPATARNIGWKYAKAEIVAFTDDDTIPDTQWLKEGLVTFKNAIAAVTGKVIVPLPDTPTDYEKNTAHLATAAFVTANCFIKKQALRKVKGFDETFKAAWREDSDMHFTLVKNNLQIVKQPHAIVVHPIRKTSWGVSIKEQKKSMYNALLYKKHPTLYVKHIQAIPPWNYYLIVGSFFLMLLDISGHFYLFALLFATTWIVFTFLFFFQRINHATRSFHQVSDILVSSFVIPFLSIYWRLFGAIKYRVHFY